jgi:hypothetical protein
MNNRLSAFGCVLIVGLIKAGFVAAQEPSPSVSAGSQCRLAGSRLSRAARLFGPDDGALEHRHRIR